MGACFPGVKHQRFFIQMVEGDQQIGPSIKKSSIQNVFSNTKKETLDWFTTYLKVCGYMNYLKLPFLAYSMKSIV